MAEFLPAVLLLILPFSVQAGLVEKVFGMFESTTAAANSADVLSTSPINTPLLSALKNPDPMRATGGGDVNYDDGALVSTGPIGKDVISASKAKSNSGEISVYVVRDGDSLSQIAEMYGVNTNTILWANDLKSAKDIHPGDALVILPVAGVRHTVAAGETLASIAKKYDANVDDILQYNGLASAESLTVGTEIIVPGGEIAAPVPVIKKTIASGSNKSSISKGRGVSKSGSWLINPAPGSVETQGIHGYNGVDLASYGGKHIPIVAAASGQVIIAKSGGWNGGYGSYVVIRHSNGVQTLYAHLSQVLVGVGASVTQGDEIGIMGETGKATGVHLHFEVRGDVNPF